MNLLNELKARLSKLAESADEWNKKQSGIAGRKRRRLLRQQMIMSGILLLLLIALAVTYNTKAAERRKAQRAAAMEQSVKPKDIEVTAEVVEPETPKQRLKRVKAEAKQKGYPEDIIELLSKNKETVGFVEDFEEKKDEPIAKAVSDKLKKGEIPHLLQWDERWGYARYGTGFVATCGCGPTCMSMVISGLTGDETVTPAKVAAYSEKKGYIDEENNTYWTLMSSGGQHWGVTAYEGSKNEENVKKELKAGHPIICSVGPGDFTKIGHFIVLTKYKNGKVKVNDPFSIKNSEKMWVYKNIKDQIKALWVYAAD